MAENKKVAIIISPNWRDYGRRYLADCLTSIREQDWTGESKIFLLDNESSEESFAFLRGTAEQLLGKPTPALRTTPPQEGNGALPFEIIREEKNEGFAKTNNDAMRSALSQGFDYLVLFNIDTEVEPQTIRELVKTAESDNRIGAVQARLMLHPEKDKVNSIGNATHFLGFGYTVGFKEHLPKFKTSDNRDIFYPSGAAVLFKAEVLREVGLFDEEYWMYNEDQELGWRLWLAGWRCVLAADAVVYHKYEFSRSVTKLYWMDRNRTFTILKCYRLATLILIFPAFLLMELGLLAFSFKSGWFREKLQVYRYFLSLSNWSKLLKSRHEVQKLRKVGDRKIVNMISGKILFQDLDGLPLRIANFFFNLYWQIIKLLIVW